MLNQPGLKALGATSISQYQLSDFSVSASSLSDGTKIVTNSDGRLSQIKYANGVAVRRHDNYVLVQTAKAGFWFGDSGGRWYPLD